VMATLLWLLEHDATTILRKVSSQSSTDTAPHLGRPETSTTTSPKPQNVDST
jgi:hypothetical protein